MLVLTKQERTVLFFFVGTVFFGSILNTAFLKYPSLHNIVNLIDSDRIYSKTDINNASLEELVDIPYIGEYTAANIIRYREVNGPFTEIVQIKNVKGIRDKNYERFYKHLKITKKWLPSSGIENSHD